MKKRILLIVFTIGIVAFFIAGTYYIAIYLPQKQKLEIEKAKLELEVKIEQEKTEQVKYKIEQKKIEQAKAKIEQRIKENKSQDEGAIIFETNGIKYSERDLERLRNEREMRNIEMCGLNASYISSSQECICMVGYKMSGSTCVKDSSSDADSNVDRDDSVKYPEAKDKDENFVWWNPLTWWSHK